MSEMVERVAKAIYELRFGDLDMVKAENIARAVIEELRIPTKAMEAAANALDDWGVPSDPGFGNACALAHWEAMITEALK